MVDDALAFHREIRSQPVWKQIPEVTKPAILDAPADSETDPELVYREFREQILPYHYGNVHPRNWGWVNGQGSARPLEPPPAPSGWLSIRRSSFISSSACDPAGAKQTLSYNHLGLQLACPVPAS